MTDKSTAPVPAMPTLRADHVYAMAAFCLAVGLGIGYLIAFTTRCAIAEERRSCDHVNSACKRKGPRTSSQPRRDETDGRQAGSTTARKAQEQSNRQLASGTGGSRLSHHPPIQGSSCYYTRALDTDPRNVAVRTKLASSLYRNGDVEGAIKQLNQALAFDPKTRMHSSIWA